MDSMTSLGLEKWAITRGIGSSYQGERKRLDDFFHKERPRDGETPQTEGLNRFSTLPTSIFTNSMLSLAPIDVGMTTEIH